MVTRRHNYICCYLLHFIDMDNDTDAFESVTARNLSTLRYYANKARMTRNLLLIGFYEVFAAGRDIWLTKYRIVAIERNFKFRIYYRVVNCTHQTFVDHLETRARILNQ